MKFHIDMPGVLDLLPPVSHCTDESLLPKKCSKRPKNIFAPALLREVGLFVRKNKHKAITKLLADGYNFKSAETIATTALTAEALEYVKGYMAIHN